MIIYAGYNYYIQLECDYALMIVWLISVFQYNNSNAVKLSNYGKWGNMNYDNMFDFR